MVSWPKKPSETQFQSSEKVLGWPDSTRRTASCLNSSVYLLRFPFLTFISLRYYSSSLRDTFYAGKVRFRVILAVKDYNVGMAVANKSVAAFVPSHAPKGRPRIGATLGLKSMDVPALIKAASAGLSWNSVKKFLGATGFNQQQLANYLDIPERTFARRRETGALDRRESEKLLRLAEIWEAGLDLFDGDEAQARAWLVAPAFGLGNVAPIDYARTEFGGREVRALIGRIADGVFF